MREISFRAWDSYQNKMYDWNELIRMDIKNYLSLSNLLNGFIGHITPMQSTGLKDKHGKMIFEGDVLTPHFYADYTKDNRFKCEILFKNGMFCFGINKPFIDTLDSLHASLKRGKKAGNDYIVIGNKWENPELLKQ